MTPQRLGQHFLADENWRQRIARAIPPGGVWIEIGAGHGEMTELLAKTAERVVAVELDSLLLPKLTQRIAPLGNVTLAAGDVMELDLAELAGAERFSVYGNLPYYITSPIVHRILKHADRIDTVFLVMQMEVAERLVAPPGGSERGYFSAFTQFYASPQILLRIPPGVFRPPPKVTSALVLLRPPGERVHLGIADEPGFLRFLKVCFAQKRKTLRNNLRALLPAARAERALEQAGIAPGARAEQLTLTQFARLFALCSDGSA